MDESPISITDDSASARTPRPAWQRYLIALLISFAVSTVLFTGWIYLLADRVPEGVGDIVTGVLFLALAPVLVAVLVRDARRWVRIVWLLPAFVLWMMFVFSVVIPVERAISDDDGGYYCC